MLPLASLVTFALAYITVVAAAPQAGSLHTFTLAPKVISPDGAPRSAALINGQLGYVLTANKGDCLSVNVVNHQTDETMRQSTSIHWHGLFQARNVENDGPSFVTQCPISPKKSYLYKLELGDQAGSFWWHSHLGTQYVDGVRGPLVIYDPQDPHKNLYDVDDLSTIIHFMDWYHGKAEAMLAAFHNNGSEPVPDSGLINGIGRFQGGPQVKLARINVVHGKRYRFRLFALSADGFFDFQIANHSLTVIEADGINHEPVTVNSVLLGPGQRYSVVVNANQPIANYWIRASQSVIGGFRTFPTNPNFNGNRTTAVLRYAGAPDAEPKGPAPTELAPGEVALQEFNLKPLENPGSPGGEFPENFMSFNFAFNIGSPNGDIWTVNGVQYKSPSVPTLLNILANGFTNTSQFGPNENTLVLPRNTTVEIRFNGASPVGAGHAFHLHGHAFDVVQSAQGPPNYINPPRRDVVQSAATETRVRFRTDNPGPWFVHCHIDWHLENGLAVVFVEDPQGIKSGPQSTSVNTAWKDLCSIYDKLSPSQQ